LSSIPRRRIDPAEAKLKRQQRNQRYRANITRKQEKEQDIPQQQLARLRQCQVPLRQLAEIAIEQQYSEAENDMMDEGMMVGSVGEEGGIVDANNMMEEDGENFRDGHWNEGFPDEIGSEMNDDGNDEPDGGFGDDSVESDMNDDGSQIVIYY